MVAAHRVAQRGPGARRRTRPIRVPILPIPAWRQTTRSRDGFDQDAAAESTGPGPTCTPPVTAHGLPRHEAARCTCNQSQGRPAPHIPQPRSWQPPLRDGTKHAGLPQGCQALGEALRSLSTSDGCATQVRGEIVHIYRHVADISQSLGAARCRTSEAAGRFRGARFGAMARRPQRGGIARVRACVCVGGESKKCLCAGWMCMRSVLPSLRPESPLPTPASVHFPAPSCRHRSPRDPSSYV